MEGAVEGDDPRALGLAVDEVVAARGLDRALDRLRAGVAEEDLVGEGQARQPLGERLLLRHAVEVGDVPELLGLLGQRRDQRRVGMAERGDRDAAGKIEHAAAVGRLSHAPSPRTKAIGARLNVS